MKWLEWQELLDEFQDYAHVKIEKSAVKEFIGKTTVFRVENLEKL